MVIIGVTEDKVLGKYLHYRPELSALVVLMQVACTATGTLKSTLHTTMKLSNAEIFKLSHRLWRMSALHMI